LHENDCSTDEQYDPLNKLACRCMVANQCPLTCSEDQRLDPFEVCECIGNERLYEYFPEWVSMDEIDYSISLAWDHFSHNEVYGNPCDPMIEDCPCDPTLEECPEDDGAM